jgi:hypothetical protein
MMKKTLTRFNQVGVDGFAEPARSFCPLAWMLLCFIVVGIIAWCLFALSCGLLELDGWVQEEGCWFTYLPTYVTVSCLAFLPSFVLGCKWDVYMAWGFILSLSTCLLVCLFVSVLSVLSAVC